MTTDLPRPEYPRPTLVRESWLNLNGTWSFEMDPGNVGLKGHWQTRQTLAHTIMVPFCVESEASGIGERHSSSIVWYQRAFDLPPDWLGQRVLLHIGACDHWTRVFVNGGETGQNRGGYAPFSIDITHAVTRGENRIAIRVEDGPSWSQPRGKQEGTTRWPIDYDGVTGIWQTVWIEPVPSTSIEELHSSFKLENFELRMTAGLSNLFIGKLEVTVSHQGKELATTEAEIDQRGEAKAVLEIADNSGAAPLWSPDTPSLCDIRLVLRDASGHELDRVHSYVGLREIQTEAGAILLNGSPLYIRGVLDQGYFPHGWYTAPDDDAIRQDIELTRAMGFNCARKHQKAEDPRYLYWADRLGLLVWAEMPSGRIFSSDLIQSLSEEWMRLIRRDRAHPCIMAWVPFNESWGVWNQIDRSEQRAFVDALVYLTKSLDNTRLVIGNDGWEYSSGDLWTLHLYEGDGTPFDERLQRVLDNPQAQLFTNGRVGAFKDADVTGLPVLLTECGGVGFVADEHSTGAVDEAFAYGDIPTTPAELERRFRAIAADINAAEPLTGFVWTQLTDIQQEINGVLTFDRKPKIPIETLKEIFTGIGF